jgi:hypothetical protein
MGANATIPIDDEAVDRTERRGLGSDEESPPVNCRFPLFCL